MKKLSIFTLLLSLAAAGQIIAQTVDSVNFNNYVSATNNDLANKFTGTFTMAQQTTGGITGGAVVPAASVSNYNDALFYRQYGFNLTAPNPLSVSVCFKYTAATAGDGNVGPQVGLVLQNDSIMVNDYIHAYLAYSSDVSASNLFIAGVGQNFGTAQFVVTDGHWYKLELTTKATSSDTAKASAYLYDIGTAGATAPVLIKSLTNQPVLISHIVERHSYFNATMNGGADGGVALLDNFNVDGYYYTTGVEEVDMQKHFNMPTIVTTALPVTTDLKNEISYAVYSTAGVVLKKGAFSAAGNINVSDIPAANYLIRFLSNGSLLTRKFVKL